METESFSPSKHLILNILVTIIDTRIDGLATTFGDFFVLNDGSINFKPIK